MARKKLVDWKDVQILNIVQRDGRITSRELSKRIELTESPTFTRLQNLIKKGTIKWFRESFALSAPTKFMLIFCHTKCGANFSPLQIKKPLHIKKIAEAS